MILAKTCYKTHNGELLAIIETFKTWRHYLKGCKHKVLIFIDHNNLWQFMGTERLSSCQVRWAQELSYYHFQIDYRQGKANAAADALFLFLQRSLDEEEKLWAKNTQIFHRLQISLTKASLASFSLSGVSASSKLSPLYQVFICGTHGLPQLCHFWDTFRLELINKGLYKVNIGSIRLRLQELQETNSEAQELRQQELRDGPYQDINEVLHYQGLFFMPKAIWMELIRRHHDDPLAGHFGIKKTYELLAKK